MKILYCASNRVGANSQLSRILPHIDGNHTVKIAAYLKSSESLPHISWTLDALDFRKKEFSNWTNVELFGKGFLSVNSTNLRIYLKDIEAFDPDLMIVDGEPISAHIAKKLGITLWYCSPIHLLDGIKWETSQLKYLSRIASFRKALRDLPEPDLKLIYSPFGDIKFRPNIKDDYKWVTPYHENQDGKIDMSFATSGMAIVNDTRRFSDLSKLLNSVSFNLKLFSPFNEKYSNISSALIGDKRKYSERLRVSKWLFTTGETSYISDAFYNYRDICIAPTLDDFESIMNSIICKLYDVGIDLSQIELRNEFALDPIEESFNRNFNIGYLSKQDRPLLHERIELYAAHST